MNLLYSDRLASVLDDVTRIQLPSGCGGGKAANTDEKVKTAHCKYGILPLVVASEQIKLLVIVFSDSFVSRVDRSKNPSKPQTT